MKNLKKVKDMSNKITRLEAPELLNGTSFHDCTIVATPQELCEILGDPDFEDHVGRDKTRMEWYLEVDGKPFSLYDWKYYTDLNMHEKIVWHIGAKDFSTSALAQDALNALLQPGS